jgi:hypothetical protein
MLLYTTGTGSSRDCCSSSLLLQCAELLRQYCCVALSHFLPESLLA